MGRQERVYAYGGEAQKVNEIIKEMFERAKGDDEHKVKIYLKNPATQQIKELTEAVELITLVMG